jgi:V/A-type H+-transporting ATPase subunit I
MVHAVGILNAANAVELDPEPFYNASLDIEAVRNFLIEFAVWERRYRHYLPTIDYCPIELPGPPTETAQAILEQMHRWDDEARPYLAEIEELSHQHDRLMLLREFILAAPESGLDLSLLADKNSTLETVVYACPRRDEAVYDASLALVMQLQGSQHSFWVVVGTHTASMLASLQQQGCQAVLLPDWLEADTLRNQLRIETEIREVARNQVAGQHKIRALVQRYDLISILGNVGLLRWYVDNAPAASADKGYCRVTGWTGEADPELLTQLLKRAGIDAMVRFPAEPVFAHAPTHLRHAKWVQPFEFFTRLLGTPARDEVDPTPLLAFIVPLLFGYMFPDVGHGVILIIVGFAFARRWPSIRFLVPCGVSAVVFGFLFGDIFGFHDIIPAFWLSPLDEPLTVLLVPLIAGVVLILLGMALASLEAYWRGRLRIWLAVDAAVLGLYAATVSMIFWTDAAVLMMIAVVWYFLGTLYVHPANPVAALGLGLVKLLESVSQLVLNTLSFARVGAFALAHAGLSSAVISLSEQIDTALLQLFVLLVGNVFVIVLEGLVVFVQTTRLVLFEFFIRFLRAEGRVFRPFRPVTPARSPGND